MRVVDLADEFGTTTAEMLESCDGAGVRAVDGAHELTDAEVDTVRRLRTLAVSAPSVEDPALGPPVASTPGYAESAAPHAPTARAYAASPAMPGIAAGASSVAKAGSGSGPGSHTAVFAVTASLLGLCLPIVPAIIGIVLGTVAKRQAKAAGSFTKVSGPATAAQVLGVIFLLGWGAYFAVNYFGQHATVTVGDTPVGVQRTAFPDVKATDCLALQKATSVEDLLVAPCSDPHDAEVIGFVDLDYNPTVGEEDTALARCKALATQAGITGRVVVGALIPNGAGRTVASHRATCILHYADNHAYIGRI